MLMIKLRSNFSNNVSNTNKLNYSLSAKHFKILNLFEDESANAKNPLTSKKQIKASYTPSTNATTTTNKFSFKRTDRTNDELSMQKRVEKFKVNKEVDKGDGIDWLKKLTSSSSSNDDLQTLSHLSDSKKTNLIEKHLAEKGEVISKHYVKKYWRYLMRANDVSQLKTSITFLERITEWSEYETLEVDENATESQYQNMPAHNFILPEEESVEYDKIINKILYYRKYSEKYANNLLTKLIAEHTNPTENRLPSLIFDCRYFKKTFSSPFLIRRIVGQFTRAVADNNRSPHPFKIKFYNYSSNTDFHKDFPDVVNFFDRNLIDVYEHSYLDDFNKKQLIYLSKDSKIPMTEYDPSKTYIIGSLVHEMTGEKLASISTAKQEGVLSQYLPINNHLELQLGVDLNRTIPEMMRFMLNVNSGLDMRASLINIFGKKFIKNIKMQLNGTNSYSPDEMKKLQLFHYSITRDKLKREDKRAEENKDVIDYSVRSEKRKLTLFENLIKKDKLENEISSQNKEKKRGDIGMGTRVKTEKMEN